MLKTVPLLAILIANCAAQSLIPEIPKLDVAGRFDLAKILSNYGLADVRVRDLQTAPGRLVFLVQGRDVLVTQDFLVSTDASGAVNWLSPLGNVDVLDLHILGESPSEVLLTMDSLDSKSTQNETRRYDAMSGVLLERKAHPKGSPIPMLGASGRFRFRLSWSGNVVDSISNNSRPAIRVPSLGRQLIHSRGALAGVVDSVSGVVSLLNQQDGKVTSAAILHPEILRIKRIYENEGKSRTRMVVLAATMDAHGRTLLVVSNFRPEDGAPIVVLDPDLKVQTTFRLPVMDMSSGKPIVPAAIATSQKQLFVSDPSGRTLSFYLPF